MPRHPPCALHSLSHKYSTKTTRHLCRGSCDNLRRAESTSTQLQKTSRLSTIMRETEKIATPDSRLLGETLRRCSRPLFRDQGACPRGPATRGWTVPWGESSRLCYSQGPDVSGPNSVSGLRSPSRCAGSTPGPLQSRGGSTERPFVRTVSFIDDSTSE